MNTLNETSGELAETAVVMEVAGEEMLGIMHEGAPNTSCGVLLVVGGPQYRAGSHRQFLLLARELAANGVPVFRFDYRGMGDSSGPQSGFEDAGEDIRAALDVFQRRAPEVRQFVIWGLCDAASAALLHAWNEPRVSGLVLVNPWVRTDEGLARAHLRHYYIRRVASREFWRDVVQGQFHPLAAAGGFLRTLVTSLGAREDRARGDPDPAPPLDPRAPLPERMAAGWCRFRGSILVVLSGEDLTAAEFTDTARNNRHWQGLLDEDRVSVARIDEANHTFSRADWRQQVADYTRQWLLRHAETAA